MEIKIELSEKSGVYCLMNLVNGKRYIGSTKNLYDRLRTHLSLLRNNRSHNKHLQSSWNKHGEEKFVFFALEYCDENNIFEKEQKYIDFIKPEYNFSLNVTANIGRCITDEQKEKISNTLKEKYSSGEITTYKQNHNWKHCYIYNIEDFTLYKECQNLSDAFTELKTKYSVKERIDTSIYGKKYCISYEKLNTEIDTKNYICEKLLCRINNTGIKEYLISEDNLGNLKYHKNIQDCANYVGSSRSTLNKHMDASKENPYYIKGTNFKIYLSKDFIPFIAVF